MKKLTLITLFILCLNTIVNAQNEFKKIKVFTGLGYAAPNGGGGGFIFDFEPAYRIIDPIAVGFRFEAAGLVKDVDGESLDLSLVVSYTLNGQYYFTNGGFRPYIGIGLGVYEFGSVSLDSQSGSADTDSQFGFYPRIGFDAGHFNLNVDFNIVPDSEIQGIDLNGNSIITNIKNSYIGIRIGGVIGGGRN